MKTSLKYIFQVVQCVLFLTVMFSCNVKSNSEGAVAFLGGEIINPKNRDVVLFRFEDKASDTLRLDNNNRFIHRFDNFKAGIYEIWHGNEYQIVVLEPNDSIMFRVNTYDFDESLVFTGKGSKKNNYLIKTFLSYETERRKLMKYSQMNPEEFHVFVEKRRQNQLNEFTDFIENNTVSPFFESIIEAVFNYNSYADKEIYPFAYYGNNKLIHIKDLPENFYEYRDKINLNDKNLSDLYFYDRFLFAHFDNLALKAFYDEHPYHSTFNRYSLNYNKAKLDMIDSMISDDSIKNKLLKKKTRDFIITNTDESETTEMLNYFLVKSTNQDHKDEIQDLVLSLKALEKGNTIPNIAIVDIDGNEHNLAAVISNPTIIYFWTSNLKRQFRNSHYKAKELKEKFPEMDFISININDNNDRYWKKIIKQYDFPSTTEYRFKNSKEALQVLAVNIVNKAIVVDTNARILHSNTNIFRSEFGEILEGILQKKAL